MALALVQSDITSTGSGVTAKSTTFGSNVTVGNTIVVGVQVTANNNAGTVTDTLGNTYTVREADAGDPKALFYTAPVTTGGACTVTYTAGGASAGGVTVAVAEVSSTGATSRETGGIQTGSSATLNSASISPTVATIMFAITSFGPFETHSVGGGFTEIETSSWPNMDVSLLSRTGAAGTYQAVWNNSASVVYESAILALKESGGGGGGASVNALFLIAP
jgi:hypothetical protein